MLKKTNAYFSFIYFFFLSIFFKYFFYLHIYQNDYLNPYTLTFKNPKTLQMYNIIILYHYVMAFLVAVIIFTFIFIFLSFFRSYFYFYIKPAFKTPYNNYSEIFKNEPVGAWIFSSKIYLLNKLFLKKLENMDFYKKDIKASLKDQVTHAPLLEFFWVVFPALILVMIAYPSIMMLYYNEIYVDPVFNITVIGNQWYWTYEYNDFNLQEIFKKHISSEKSVLIRNLEDIAMRINEEKTKFGGTDLNQNFKLREGDREILKQIPRRLTVDCNMIIAKDPKFLRLLTTDQCLVIPSKTPIRLLITSNDVIHSWAVPSYGIKLDAVPGRVNQQLLNVPLMGTSWGQCSELCGVNHAYMPIEIKVLAFGDFLFFMELRLKEILTPHFITYYKERLNIIQKFCLQLENYVKNNGTSKNINIDYVKSILVEDKIVEIKNRFPKLLSKYNESFKK